MFRLSFKKSHSKNYKEVLKLASYFKDHKFKDNRHLITMSLTEVFSKWEFFNLLFWLTVKWKGSYFGFEEIDLYSHTDRTRIFYALQDSHLNWLCVTDIYIARLHLVAKGEMSIEELRAEVYNDYHSNWILDVLVAEQNKVKFEKGFGHLDFETPLRVSDFGGRRARREAKKNEENK